MKIFVTGSAGFVGFHVAQRLLDDGHTVMGYDGMTDYYDVRLKQARHAILRRQKGFSGIEAMLEDEDVLRTSMMDFEPDVIIHLAAQAGVRHSITNPAAYISANIIGTSSVLEIARELKPEHLMIASTSSIYGSSDKVPFGELDRADHPVSLYAATKKAGEAMSHSYAHLFKIPTTCFRFFTVYGPWGRPDMAPFKFVDRIARGKQIDVFGHGDMRRDFTFIDDLVVGVTRLAACPPIEGQPVTETGVSDSLSPVAPWRVVNLGGGQPVELMHFIATIEEALGKQANRRYLDMQPGDVPLTFADPSLLRALTGFEPSTPIEVGVKALVNWYRGYEYSA